MEIQKEVQALNPTLMIKQMKNTTSLSMTKAQEITLLADLYEGTLIQASHFHNERHPVKTEYRVTFTLSTDRNTQHMLTTELSINGVWHMLSRHLAGFTAGDPYTPRINLYHHAFIEMATSSLIFSLSTLVDPVTLNGGPILKDTSGTQEAEIIEMEVREKSDGV